VRYKVVMETITEEVVEIEADSETQAYDLVVDGGGELVDQTLFAPVLLGVQELEDDD
jgi:CobQ-like glutamine amidotransferase family enzyme